MRARARLLPVLLLALGSCAEPEADFTLLNTEPESIDPALSSGVPDARIVRALFCGLTVSDPETLASLPELASSWEASPDQRTWTFHLREATWSDGVPITSADFVWSAERVLNPASEAKFADLLYIIENAEEYRHGEVKDFAQVGVLAPDPRTVVYRLEAPIPYFTQLTSFEPFYPTPRHVIERHGASFWTRPGKIVSSGPFLLDEWRFRDRMWLSKNRRFWDAEHVQLERVRVLQFETENTGFTLYETGLGDWVDKSGIPVGPLLEELKGRPDFQSFPWLGVYQIAVNTTYKPFDDPRVRQAFSLAIDRRSIVENVTRAGERPATSWIYPDLPGYAPPPGYRVEEDRERARALLAEAGYPGGKGLPYLEYLYNTLDMHRSIAELLQRQWKDALGVQVELRNTEWQVYLEDERRLRHKPFSRSGWIGDYLDPSTFLRTLTRDAGNNYSGYRNPEYDATVTQALREPDVDRRRELYQKAEAMVIRDLPIIPLYWYVQVHLVKPYVRGAPGNLLDKLNLRWVSIDREARERWREEAR